jgi:glycolate oxidase iron-sulfur subunit
MQHDIPLEKIGPQAEPMTKAIESCVHCGFCLPTCPTYVVTGEEMNSPRGRILLMKNVLEGDMKLDDATPYLDPCLGCLACVTACPSGVQYGDLITPFRMKTEDERARTWFDKTLRRFVLETLPYPGRFRAAATLGRLAKPLKKLLPERMAGMLELLPERVPKSKPLPEVFPAQGERRARVALLAGCAQQVLAPDINWATLRVLAKNGVEVVIPKGQSCCGALAAHTGVSWQAKAFARHNLKAFPKDVDAILTNAAGCGSGMHEYGLWLKGELEEAEANAFSKRVNDVSVFLAELGFKTPKPLRKPLKVAYHDACHLAHAQGVTVQPRQLLKQIESLTLLEINENELCCGSAGTYNIEHPDIAKELGGRKANNIKATGAQAVATGNIGCLTQLQTHLGEGVPVYHTMQLIDRAYRGV